MHLLIDLWSITSYYVTLFRSLFLRAFPCKQFIGYEPKYMGEKLTLSCIFTKSTKNITRKVDQCTYCLCCSRGGTCGYSSISAHTRGIPFATEITRMYICIEYTPQENFVGLRWHNI